MVIEVEPLGFSKGNVKVTVARPLQLRVYVTLTKGMKGIVKKPLHYVDSLQRTL